jgi:hypothetical protein
MLISILTLKLYLREKQLIMKKVLLIGTVLMGFVSMAQKEVVCSYTDPETKKTTSTTYKIMGDVCYEGDSDLHEGMKEIGYAYYDGENIILTEYTVNNDKSCRLIFEYTIPKSDANLDFEASFMKTSEKYTRNDGVVVVSIGSKLGIKKVIEKVKYGSTEMDRMEIMKTAKGKFQNEAKFKAFFDMLQK